MAAKKPPKRAWICWNSIYGTVDAASTKKGAGFFVVDDHDQVVGPYVLETRPKRKAKKRRTDGELGSQVT